MLVVVAILREIFSIRTLISIAGIDGLYLPAGKAIPLKNVNYLALQGAHDMDVNSFDSTNGFLQRIGCLIRRIRVTGFLAWGNPWVDQKCS